MIRTVALAQLYGKDVHIKAMIMTCSNYRLRLRTIADIASCIHVRKMQSALTVTNLEYGERSMGNTIANMISDRIARSFFVGCRRILRGEGAVRRCRSLDAGVILCLCYADQQLGHLSSGRQCNGCHALLKNGTRQDYAGRMYSCSSRCFWL